MSPTDHTVALALRDALVADGLEPAAFRRTMSQVVAEDRDAWLDVVWDLDELPKDDARLPSGCVPYLPCPVDTILEAVDSARTTAADVFVDIGAGMGRAAALAHLLTGARTIGLELQPALVKAARERAQTLGLDAMTFIEGDAIDTIQRATSGSVFFMYCPFGRTRIGPVLDALATVAQRREIHICCVGMASLSAAWLRPLPTMAPDLAVYRSGSDLR